MESRTLEELRAEARALGLKGYSKLRKDELLRLLANKKSRGKTATAARTRPAAPAHGKRAAGRATTVVRALPDQPPTPGDVAAKPATRPPATQVPARRAPPEPGVQATAGSPRLSSDEERVEDAKYASGPPGMGGLLHTPGPELGEDIDQLPQISEPTLCLLPQKPGILHAYWVLPVGSLARQPSLKLRLCQFAGGALSVLTEQALPGDHGHWYFHVGAIPEGGELLLQLGFHRDGEFVPAIYRGTARMPSLYASRRTDRLWWISEQRFREMYLRAGGFTIGRRLGWAASRSSPGGEEFGGERLGWSGSVINRQ